MPKTGCCLTCKYSVPRTRYSVKPPTNMSKIEKHTCWATLECRRYPPVAGRGKMTCVLYGGSCGEWKERKDK